MSEVRFDGRVAIVTGAGGGLGRTYAEELARRGAKVVVNDLGGATDGTGGGASMADETVDAIREAGGEAVANYDSVATPEGGQGIVGTALEVFGGVDIVINNAGILRDKSFAKLEVADLDAIIDVHLKGAFYVTQPAFRVMKDRGYGRILFTSSSSGIWGNFGQTNYGAAKTGLLGLSNVISIEGAKHNIQSNVIAPAAQTRLTAGLGGGGEPDEAQQRLQDPRQVTSLSCFLVSEDCPLTHEVFAVGYGRVSRVFIGMSPPWFHEGEAAFASLEDIRDNLETIMSTDGFTIPKNTMDEMAPVFAHLKGE
jgi:NAD(P)-dependent dehydrogenase (short-subunit alcohol dehydrogenase family)